MDNISLNMQNTLTFLIYATIVMGTIITVFLVKLLIDLSNLAVSLQSLTSVIKYELEPTIKELKRALCNITSVASDTDKQVDNLGKTLNKGLGIMLSSSIGILGRARILSSSFSQGIIAGMRVFANRNK